MTECWISSFCVYWTVLNPLPAFHLVNIFEKDTQMKLLFILEGTKWSRDNCPWCWSSSHRNASDSYELHISQSDYLHSLWVMCPTLYCFCLSWEISISTASSCSRWFMTSSRSFHICGVQRNSLSLHQKESRRICVEILSINLKPTVNVTFVCRFYSTFIFSH